MTDEKRIKNVVGISDTLWQLNKFTVLGQIEKLSGTPVPDDCMDLIECSFRFGAVLMEKALCKKRALPKEHPESHYKDITSGGKCHEAKEGAI